MSELTSPFTEEITVADFENQKPLICEVKWLTENHTEWEDCNNIAKWVGMGHDEEDCNLPDEFMLVCDSCFKISQKYGVGNCGHKLFYNFRPL